MCRNLDPWFVPSLLAIWGPTLLSIYHGPPALPARDIAHALAEAWEEEEAVVPLAAAPEASGSCSCPPTPPPCPALEDCTLDRWASRWSFTRPDLGWFGVVATVAGLRVLESLLRAVCGRRRSGHPRGVQIPALAHY